MFLVAALLLNGCAVPSVAAESVVVKTMTDKELTLSDQLMIRYHCGGILKVIYDWMERNCPETPEEIAEILSEMASGKHRMYSNPFFQNIYKPKPPKR